MPYEVRFDTGETVEFQKMPTDSDIEEVVKKLGIKPKTAVIPDKPKEPSYTQRLGADLVNTANDITSSLGKALETPKSIPDAVKKGFVDTPRAALRIVGGVASTALSPITEAPAVKGIAQAIGGQVAKIPGVSELVSQANELAIKYPEQAKDLQNVLDILAFGGGAKPAEQAIKKTGEAATEVGSKTAVVTGNALKSAGEQAYSVGVPMKDATKIALQTYDANQPSFFGRLKNFLKGTSVGEKPITEANTAARKGLVGTEWQLGVQAKKVSNDLWNNIIKPKLQSAGVKVDMKSLINSLEDDISKIPELGRRNEMKDALDAFRSDFKNVGKVSLEKLQEYKEGWAKFIPEKSYKGKPIGTAFKDIQNQAAEKARKVIYDTLGPEARQAYFDYGNLKSIEEAGIKSIDLLRSKGFTKQAWELVLDKLVTPVSSAGGSILYRTGDGLEFIGKLGAKKVKDIFK